MPELNVTLAPGVPDLAALGASAPEDLLGAGRPLEEEHRAQDVETRPGLRHLRVPLPGTPDGDGPLRSRPRGAGTGWLDVVRYSRPGLWPLLRARFTAPRSASLAEREWNLLCHLRHGGLSTPEPLAVVRRGNGLVGGHSALVTRALEDFEPAERVLHSLAGPRRRQALRAIGFALGKLFGAEVELPRFVSEQLLLSTASPSEYESPADACGLEQVLSARSKGPEPAPVPGLAWNELPEVALASVRGGRLRPGGMRSAARDSMRAELDRAADRAGLSGRERRLVAAAASRRLTETSAAARR